MPRGAYWLQKIAQYCGTTKRFERYLKTTKHISLGDGNYKGQLVVDEDHLSVNGQFHEGLTATLVDVSSFWALLSHGNGFSGVSTNIHISYFQPAFPGDVLSIDAQIVRVDHPLASIEIQLSKKNGEEVVARGQHTVFMKPFTDNVEN